MNNAMCCEDKARNKTDSSPQPCFFCFFSDFTAKFGHMVTLEEALSIVCGVNSIYLSVWVSRSPYYQVL